MRDTFLQIIDVVNKQCRCKEVLACAASGGDDFCDALVEYIAVLRRCSRSQDAMQHAQKLATLHQAQGRFCEAGNALVLAAGMCEWSDPAKVSLLSDASTLFVRGRAFERALRVLRDIQLEYERCTKYTEASEIALRQASVLKVRR